MLKRLKSRIAKLFEKEQLEVYQIPRFITSDQVLQFTSNGWYLGKRRLTPEDCSTLKLEAQQFGESFMWKLMRNDIHYVAYLQGTAKRRTEEDALYAGAMYKDLEILEQFIEQCRKL